MSLITECKATLLAAQEAHKEGMTVGGRDGIGACRVGEALGERMEGRGGKTEEDRGRGKMEAGSRRGAE